MSKNLTRRVPASVVRVIDADTFVAVLDIGWHISFRVTVRVQGINALELSTEAGRQAREYAVDILVPGLEVIVESHKLDKYGRTQAVVFLPDGRNYAHVLVDAGHATFVMGYS